MKVVNVTTGMKNSDNLYDEANVAVTIGIIGGMIIIANIIVLRSIQMTYRGKLNAYKLLVVSLTASDILVGVMLLLKLALYIIPKQNITISNISTNLDEIVKDFTCLGMHVTILNLNLIAAVRAKVVESPFFKQKITRRLVIKVIASLWIVACVTVIPYRIAMNRFCPLQISIMPTILCILTSILLCYHFYRIIITLQNRTVNFIRLTPIRGSRNAKNILLTSSRNVEKKTVHIAMVTIFAFFVCWMPFSLYNICLMAGFGKRLPVFLKLNDYLMMVTYSNSLLNPLIYLLSLYPIWVKKTGELSYSGKHISISTSL